MPREPRSPHIFFGRDFELAQIIHMIFTNIGSRPAHIAILGPGSYGKSTLANAVLTHERVQKHFEDARYLVTCESVFSSGALLIELAKTLGVIDGATGALWTRIHTALNSKDCILCLDNFESP
jgi:AAA+ ATPase superfamily predicted ATPase